MKKEVLRAEIFIDPKQEEIKKNSKKEITIESILESWLKREKDDICVNIVVVPEINDSIEEDNTFSIAFPIKSLIGLKEGEVVILTEDYYVLELVLSQNTSIYRKYGSFEETLEYVICEKGI